MKITDFLSKEEIKAFVKPSDWKGAQAVLTTWLLIAASFYLCARYPSWISYSIALVILGGRHLALAILMHDASHYSLFQKRWLNDFVGTWFCSYPTWQDLYRYRAHHMAHHQFAGSEKDPDISLVRPFPVSRKSLSRKLLRDLSGITGLKRIYGLILMDLGFIKYTVAAETTRLQPRGKIVYRSLLGVVITNLFLFFLLSYFGHPKLYLLWVISYLTTFSVFIRIRSIAEHACTAMDLDPMKNTRTTHANLPARLTVAPHYVNYHLEHHLLMTVPHFRFRELHRLLQERGALAGAQIAKGYLEVLRLACS